jgi:epoxyqueuosine reductase
MIEKKEEKSHGEWIVEIVRGFVRSPENSLRNEADEPAWDEPLIGFSRGDDPLYAELKGQIGAFYWTPAEIFKESVPGTDISPRELSVIAWVLPQTRATKMDNRKETQFPSERWTRSRKYGEEFNVKLRTHLIAALNSHGHEALAPQLSPLWGMRVSEKYGLCSTWSERHAAYVSGLGTFGLCDGLITAKGKAMRCGSVIARITVPPTPRPYNKHTEYCLFHSTGACGKCMDRCPAGAITKEGHDKLKCQRYVDSVTADYVKEHFGLDKTYGCGLCQTRVPCESQIPAAKR